MLGEADDLYALAVTDFTRSRDARAAELKTEDKELAARVKALRKPTVAAWAVNVFVRREAEQVEQLLDLGAALRDAQSALDGDELRALSRQRRQVTAAMASRARAVAADEGQRLTQSVVDQVETTFTAALLDEGAAAAVRSGLLVQAIAVTGVEAVDLTGSVALPDALGFTAPPREAPPQEEAPRPVLRLVPDPERRTKERRAAKEEVAAAERAVTRAARAQRAALRRVDDLEARLLRLRSEADELRRKVAHLEAEAEEVDEELVEAEEAREEADGELAAAEGERDDAAEVLARLERD
ncbi:hypothetical protein E2C04_06790 [Nocardioides daphniae]|uniref:Uncharacterized protein n=1 Tax=Nocardioides daphniae TaxID=402297 RepID=A0A4P7UES2_9ACTN|nr:hypothetical protein E2C04_06790 [Nocardioides daphniae]